MHRGQGQAFYGMHQVKLHYKSCLVITLCPILHKYRDLDTLGTVSFCASCLQGGLCVCGGCRLKIIMWKALNMLLHSG